jgi:hypothetical protein
MDKYEINMHMRAGTAAGKERTCGMKIQHSTLDSAQSHADALNKRAEVQSGKRDRVEPYPCPWCSPSLLMAVLYWHVGREMTPEEREQYKGLSWRHETTQDPAHAGGASHRPCRSRAVYGSILQCAGSSRIYMHDHTGRV